MLNLLFISDSPKIELIKNRLQPLLKVIIDVVPDFDHGLKDVFEKRPATVCIQDHISGVTGESVARHIQMLLGASAPTFILIHEGNSKAKRIKGLFEYVVDLNQSEANLAEHIQSTLKVIIGEQWDKVFIPPILTTATIRASAALSGDSLIKADKLVDDFLLDLETSSFAVVDDTLPTLQPEAAQEQEEILVLQTAADELAEMLLEQAEKARNLDGPAEKKHNSAAIGHNLVSEEVPEPRTSINTNRTGAPSPDVLPAKSREQIRTPLSEPKPIHDASAKAEKVVKTSNPADLDDDADRTVSNIARQVSPVDPSEFLVSQEKTHFGEKIPNDLLMAFEENYRSESRSKRIIIYFTVLVLILAAGGWYLLAQKSDLFATSTQRIFSIAKPPGIPTTNSQMPVTQPVPNEQKAGHAKVEKSPPPVLPSFIPRDGHDKSFAAKNPGWERYIGKHVEFRIFIADGKPKAIQLIADRDSVIAESLVKTVLTEFAGSADYKIISQENRSGFLVSRASSAQKADVLFYRKGSTLQALVVSVN